MYQYFKNLKKNRLDHFFQFWYISNDLLVRNINKTSYLDLYSISICQQTIHFANVKIYPVNLISLLPKFVWKTSITSLWVVKVAQYIWLHWLKWKTFCITLLKKYFTRICINLICLEYYKLIIHSFLIY